MVPNTNFWRGIQERDWERIANWLNQTCEWWFVNTRYLGRLIVVKSTNSTTKVQNQFINLRKYPKCDALTDVIQVLVMDRPQCLSPHIYCWICAFEWCGTTADTTLSALSIKNRAQDQDRQMKFRKLANRGTVRHDGRGGYIVFDDNKSKTIYVPFSLKNIFLSRCPTFRWMDEIWNSGAFAGLLKFTLNDSILRNVEILLADLFFFEMDTIPSWNVFAHSVRLPFTSSSANLKTANSNFRKLVYPFQFQTQFFFRRASHLWTRNKLEVKLKVRMEGRILRPLSQHNIAGSMPALAYFLVLTSTLEVLLRFSSHWTWTLVCCSEWIENAILKVYFMRSSNWNQTSATISVLFTAAERNSCRRTKMQTLRKGIWKSSIFSVAIHRFSFRTNFLSLPKLFWSSRWFSFG